MLRAQVYTSILEIGKDQWSRVADPTFPFSDYHYLASLEIADCLGARTGWFPQFVTAWDESGLVGAVVLYLKTNSYGEYIFDSAWADAFARTGQAYFPKLTSAIPFTPATGPKLLLSADSTAQVTTVLLKTIDELGAELKVSSLHALFVPPSQLAVYSSADYFLRDSFQFHWENHEYQDFAAFVGKLRSKRKKEILRERNQVASMPIQIVRLTGGQLNAEHADMFYEFYLNTIDKRQSFDYLTLDFFRNVFATMSDRILLVLALDRDERPVAGALNYFSSQTLFGRNWGCLETFKHLHFELCYYQGIEFAIARGLKRFEAGAQGEHKFQRGFLPTLTYSTHKIFHPMFAQAIRDHVEYERKQIGQIFSSYLEHNPFAE